MITFPIKQELNNGTKSYDKYKVMVYRTKNLKAIGSLVFKKNWVPIKKRGFEKDAFENLGV